MFPFSTEHPEYLKQAANKDPACFIHSFLQAESRAKRKHKAKRRTTSPADGHSFTAKVRAGAGGVIHCLLIRHLSISLPGITLCE